MPGLVVFRRRWSVGSDDLVVPGAFLVTIHFMCVITVIVSLAIFDYDTSITDVKLLFYHQIGYLAILSVSLFIEIGICIISMRGSILDSDVRAPINIWIYIKTVVILFDIAWLIMGTLWLTNYYLKSTVVSTEKKIFFAIIISNWALVFVTITTIWCTFDAAGRSWVKMKKYQRSMRETESRFNYKRSNSMNRNWRQRKVIRAYQDSWDHRCRLLFCCMGSSERNRNSFTDIARLLSDFFRELDVVPSDVVAGLVLLRKFQLLEREAIVRQRKNGTYEFLSGVPITERTQFLALNDAKNYDFFQTVIHYMYFAQGAYGWPMYFIINRSRMYNLVPELKCFGCCVNSTTEAEVIKDNCCYCNYAALKKTLQIGDIEIVYVTYHVDVGETPFFVAIDYTQKKIVVSIRGTLSMKDILTDLNAEAEVLPLNPPRDDWLGHKGMVQAAIYIRNKLEEENIIRNALNKNLERNTHTFDLVLVGHSLGAGTAAILAILMKADYPTLQCFAYSPPGGLLSMPAVEYSKTFITSVVLGKDVVPRIGLYQMEALRADLINAIQRSIDPKWKTISCSMICCCCGPEPKSVVEMSNKDTHINKYQEERDSARSASTHPADSTIALTIHQPLFPPGRIIHIVRHHPRADEKKYDSGWRNVLKSREPVYQAIWADSIDFDEVLISPVMLQDHMPDKVLAALKKVVTTSGPRKPHRQASNAFSTTSNELHRSNQDIYSYYNCSNIEFHQSHQHQHNANHMSSDSNGPYDSLDSRPSLSQTDVPTTSATTQQQSHRVCLETSFTNLHSPQMAHKHAHFPESISSSKASSLAGSILSRSQMSSIQYDISSAMENSITTVTRKSPIKVTTNVAKVDQVELVLQPLKTKCVAFEDTPSPLKNLKRQHSAKMEKKPKTLPIPPLRRASDVTNGVGADEWLGLAPLASPETLSEISSISSRNSVRNSMATSIDHYLHNVSSNNAVDINDIYESQLHTPTVLRRAPKFIENLSSCAEDSRNVDQYKRMGRVIVPPPLFTPNIQDSSEDEDSFESANSYRRVSVNNTTTNGRLSNATTAQCHRRQNSKSADQLDDVVSSTNKQQTEVVTTSGPRKPHRQASNAFSTTSNELHRSNQDIYSYYNCSNIEFHQSHQHQHNANHMSSDSNGPYDSLDSRPSLSQTDVPTTSATTQQQSHRVCLETSFTNLHSPQMAHKHAHFPESISSSKASSLAGSILSRSQMSSIQYDISSAMENSITTVTRKSPIKVTTNVAKVDQVELVLQPLKTKCVAFEDTPSPLKNLKRQHSAKMEKKPKTLPIPPLRRASDVTNGVGADEWLGLAPLASPETLSEISSISSRNSVRNSMATSIDHYLHNVSSNNAVDINDIYESQLHTPTVLRRAPKFIENLSSCAEDSRNVDQYKRMGRVIVPPPLFTPNIQDSSEDEDSFESANSYRRVSVNNTTTNGRLSNATTAQCHRRQNSKSADQLDDVVSSTNKQQTEVSVANKFNFSDSNFINDNDVKGGRAIISCVKCCNDQCNCSNQLNTPNTGSQDTTFYSANSSIDCMTAKINSNSYILPEGVLESHFPLHQDAFTNTTELYAKQYMTSFYNDQDFSTVVPTSKVSVFNSPLSTMSRGKRKNCIYPSVMSSQPMYAAIGGNVKLFTTTTTTTTPTSNNTTTNIPELTIANGSSSLSSRSQTPNESSV